MLEEMRTEHDPLASHIFLARRSYRTVRDVKSGKRSEREARFGSISAFAVVSANERDQRPDKRKIVIDGRGQYQPAT